MTYDARLELRGLLGVYHNKDDKTLWVLGVNVTQPARLRLPTGFSDEVEPHYPRLFFSDDAIFEYENIELILNAGRCLNEETWKAVNLQGFDITMKAEHVGESDLEPSGLTKLTDIASTQNSDSAVSGLTSNLMVDDYATTQGREYPLLCCRLRVDQGKVTLGTSCRYRFSFIAGSITLHEAVIVDFEGLTNPVEFEFRSLHEESDRVGKLRVRGGQEMLYLALDNNTIPAGPGAVCKSKLDFTAHYNVLKTPSLLGRYPYPVEDLPEEGDPGDADNAQCSPLDYGD